jgi:hypothetical protein
MKARIILIIILVISMLMLNSCTALYKGLGMFGQFMGALYCITTGGDDTTKITNKLEELLEAIENQDSSAIMSLFSESSKEHIEEFEASAEELINYYSGVHQSIEALSGGMSSSYNSDGKKDEQRSISNAFEVTTSECVYRMSLGLTEKDTANSENIGINYFYIIKKEDDINLFADYNGDAKETPGINIGIQNTWPDHLSYFEDDEEDDDYYE